MPQLHRAGRRERERHRDGPTPPPPPPLPPGPPRSALPLPRQRQRLCRCGRQRAEPSGGQLGPPADPIAAGSGSGMEALRAAGRAVLRSPRLARHGLGLRRRRKLPESWADMQEPLLEGMCFTLKYLGMTLVEKPKGEDMAAAAIRRIVATARVGARKFQKVILTVSPRGISLQDADTKEMVENISIYRISYCTTDKLQNKVFAYVAQSPDSGALECHAFLSPKKKIAQAVTLTVAQAFQMALDLWEAAHAGSRQEQPLHPSCVLESSEPGRPSEPAPPGSPPFRHRFGDPVGICAASLAHGSLTRREAPCSVWLTRQAQFLRRSLLQLSCQAQHCCSPQPCSAGTVRQGAETCSACLVPRLGVRHHL
uniref:PID domain-containing protein n=1 Tax=Accipiter nisus TaxID=211598 RepID=A0A8B9NRM2_9AVES